MRALSGALGARDGGWGVLPSAYRSRQAVLAGFLSPVWVPLILFALALAIGSVAFALAALGATVIFVPGVLAIANYSPWPRWCRFAACLTYAVLAEAVYVGTFYVLAKIAPVT
jgi:hypothetical protein